MRIFFHYLILGFLIVLLIGATALIYIQVALPDVGPATDLKIDYTPDRIKRGSYLANSVMGCMDCHSNVNYTKFFGPIDPEAFGMGGDKFDQPLGFPGVYYARNITPEGIARYTDGELLRVITTGVTKEGKALYPVMPYLYFGRMTTDDITSVIAYLRTLPSIKNEVPVSVGDFPFNFILNTIPKKANPPQIAPDTTDLLAYGKYLTAAAGCEDCHSPKKNFQIVNALAFSGGRKFILPDGIMRSSTNITPDNETGLGRWTKEQFVHRFQMVMEPDYIPPQVNAGEFSSLMPWRVYGGMKQNDLEAIYTYLQSLKPLKRSEGYPTP